MSETFLKISVNVYLKRRSATVVIYLKNWFRVIKTSKQRAEEVLRGGRIRKRWQTGSTVGYSVKAPPEAVAPFLIGANNIPPSLLDAVFKEAYRKSEEVKNLLRLRAYERMHYNEEATEAYMRAWLKSRDFELPPDDPDAPIAARVNPSVMWSVGGRKWVIQMPPWA
jgi:hypothetical protein